MEAQFDVLAAYRNGPRGWTMAEIMLAVGLVVGFDGLETRWMGQEFSSVSAVPMWNGLMTPLRNRFVISTGTWFLLAL